MSHSSNLAQPQVAVPGGVITTGRITGGDAPAGFGPRNRNEPNGQPDSGLGVNFTGKF